MKKNKYDRYYDERQQLARGKAYQYACITFLIEIVVMGFVYVCHIL